MVFSTTRILVKATIITCHRYQSILEDSLIAVVILLPPRLLSFQVVLMLSVLIFRAPITM